MEYVTKETNKSCLITWYTEPKAGDGKRRRRNRNESLIFFAKRSKFLLGLINYSGAAACVYFISLFIGKGADEAQG